RKFNYDSDDFPKYSEVVRKYNLDVELEASGFTKQMQIDLNKVTDGGDESESECSTIQEDDEDKDKEELRQEEKSRENESTFEEVERQTEHREEREPYIRAREELDRIEAETAQIPETSEVESHPQQRPRKARGAASTMSTTSTIPPEEIKRRVALEKMRNKEKTKLRVKGKQSAVQRGRKDNRCTIKEYKGWI
ncbi:hypothetical protein ANCDUO_15071, partial [Ancylostoma duodenale]